MFRGQRLSRAQIEEQAKKIGEQREKLMRERPADTPPPVPSYSSTAVAEPPPAANESTPPAEAHANEAHANEAHSGEAHSGEVPATTETVVSETVVPARTAESPVATPPTPAATPPTNVQAPGTWQPAERATSARVLRVIELPKAPPPRPARNERPERSERGPRGGEPAAEAPAESAAAPQHQRQSREQRDQQRGDQQRDQQRVGDRPPRQNRGEQSPRRDDGDDRPRFGLTGEIAQPRQSRDQLAELAQQAKLENVDSEVDDALGEMNLDAMYDAMEGNDVAAAMAGDASDAAQDETASSRRKDAGRADLRKGTVVALTSAGIVVTFGGKAQGIAQYDQWEGDRPNVGDEVTVEVKGYDANDDVLILTTMGAAERANWDNLHRDMIVECKVVGTNKGGLECEFNGIKGFMPLGQMSLQRIEDPETMVGKSLRAKVTDVQRRDRRVVLSAKAVEIEERETLKKEILAELAEGQVRLGRVRQLMPFGAFVDLGGVDGLIHVSDMSYGRVRDPSDVVKEGDQVEVAVLKVDWDQTDKRGDPRISLGLKQTRPDPWLTAPEQFYAGAEVEGTITRNANFGAFCELVPGIEGLIPVSEMSYVQRVRHPNDVVQEGQRVRVKVLQIDPESRRLSLSLKQLAEDPWANVDAEFIPGQETFGKITRFASFGAFCEVKPGVEGLIPLSELSYDRRVRSPQDVLKEGEQVRVKVLQVNLPERRISLSLKQTGEDPWAAVPQRFPEGSVHDGVVKRTEAFGAFIELAPGLEGLAHISELSEGRVNAVTDVCKAGDTVKVKVLEIDAYKKRISLTLRDTEPAFVAPTGPGRAVERKPLITTAVLSGKPSAETDDDDEDNESEGTQETATARKKREKEKKKKERRGGLGF